ncbi:MAG: hypothetical protein RBU30_16750 [Polyangia bacterium]|jgi:hypothetical protein|nr:hypothetical protein [Polyangia bacterium]
MAPSRTLPLAFRGRSDADDILEDVEAARGTTLAERARILEELCRMAAELTASQPDPQRVLDWQDPLSPETEALLEALRRRAAHG